MLKCTLEFNTTEPVTTKTVYLSLMQPFRIELRMLKCTLEFNTTEPVTTKTVYLSLMQPFRIEFTV